MPYSISVYNKKGTDPVLIFATFNLKFFGLFRRNSVRGSIVRLEMTGCRCVEVGQCCSITDSSNDFAVHFLRHGDFVICVATNPDYPQSVARTLCKRGMDAFLQVYGKYVLTKEVEIFKVAFEELSKEFENPDVIPIRCQRINGQDFDFDNLTPEQVQQIDRNIDAILGLSDLVQRQNDLPVTANFYKQTPKSRWRFGF